MNRLDSILHNTIFSFIARGIDVSVTFALAIILARYLGPEGMGRYTYVIAFVAIFVPLVDLGLDHILIREIAHRREAAGEYIGAALLLKLLIILVTLPLGLAITGMISTSGEEFWAILLCFIGILVLREAPTVVSYAVFLAYERMEFRALVTLLFQIVKFAFTLIVVLLGGGLISIFGAALIGEASQGLAAQLIANRKLCRPTLTFNPKLWRYFVKESLPIGIAFAFNSLYFQIDILVLKYFRTAQEIGWFSVPFRVVTTLFTLLIPMIWVLLPHMTRAARESMKSLHDEGQGYLKAIAVITAGIALYLGIEARDLVINIFGSEYEPSALVLAAVSPVIIFHAFSYYFDLTLTAVGKQKFVVVGSGVVFLVKLIADLIFVPIYGIMGAAVGTLSADLACFSVMFYLTRKYATSFNFGRIMLRPFWAAALAGIVLWFVHVWPFYLTFPVFGAAYAIFIWLFKVISPDQRRFLKEMIRGKALRFGLIRGVSGKPEEM